jgi:hypothetical protein
LCQGPRGGRRKERDARPRRGGSRNFIWPSDGGSLDSRLRNADFQITPLQIHNSNPLFANVPTSTLATSRRNDLGTAFGPSSSTARTAELVLDEFCSRLGVLSTGIPSPSRVSAPSPDIETNAEPLVGSAELLLIVAINARLTNSGSSLISSDTGGASLLF